MKITFALSKNRFKEILVDYLEREPEKAKAVEKAIENKKAALDREVRKAA